MFPSYNLRIVHSDFLCGVVISLQNRIGQQLAFCIRHTFFYRKKTGYGAEKNLGFGGGKGRRQEFCRWKPWILLAQMVIM
ncbi:MAG: hypothetical protein Ct9H300mP28_03040 [Pseudomonadota bacterium]|nr:MAG: hypothetical protein Ct9H300mP28_03040 [Pseudomonadota bacterium]